MSVWPAWEVRDHHTATTWCNVRLAFDDGAQVDVLAVLCEGAVSIEDVRARPPLSLDDLAVLSDWIEGPLQEAYGVAIEPAGAAVGDDAPEKRHARPTWPRGVEGRRAVAEVYLTAQEAGHDAVLAVMCATGRSRRGALRLIAAARDAGFLTPRHARR
ncbi:hypothetical protein FE633_02555 [Streptomyces montanus]|uniref:Uncharacterized protein n=1 Tax=Streptomyces montanus TaxID=2580423 RepID=A0A5R9G4M2_9ACTN|nr:DUF6214 family protein [Streptomyces montanus]TLS47864.1 hypothetical protein FE633_02555 [Streptomyces montanus]